VYDATRDPESCGSPGKACDPLGKAKCSAATLESEPTMLEDGGATQLAAMTDYWSVGTADHPQSAAEHEPWWDRAARGSVVQSKLAQARHAAHQALNEEFSVHQRTVVVAEGDVHKRTVLVAV
jgi:hypothetical protein